MVQKDIRGPFYFFLSSRHQHPKNHCVCICVYLPQIIVFIDMEYLPPSNDLIYIYFPVHLFLGAHYIKKNGYLHSCLCYKAFKLCKSDK